MKRPVQKKRQDAFIESLKRFIKENPEALTYKEIAKKLKEDDCHYGTKQGLWDKVRNCGHELRVKMILTLVKRKKDDNI